MGIVVWNGERGSTFFFQAEFLYDVTEEYGSNGYAGYRVASDVTTHVAHGVGVYHFFRDFPVTVQSVIRDLTSVSVLEWSGNHAPRHQRFGQCHDTRGRRRFSYVVLRRFNE